MSTETSSIDDILSNQGGVKAPEMPVHYDEPESTEPEASHEPAYDYGESELEAPSESHESDEETPDEPRQSQPDETDEYGNAKPKPRTYTEDEVNERINKAIRDRLARGNVANQQPTNQQVQQHAKDFEYDPESSDSWQAQLESFVEQTVSKMGQKQANQQQQMREQQAHAELQEKIQQGIDRYSDFREAVGSQPVTDHMTMALRGMKDPAAFIYAASKRMPQELSRISQIPDPYAQMVEMGKLEERMRQSKPATKAPRPISRTQDDGVTIPKAPKKELTIEDMIAQSDAKRKAALNARRGR
tara:strand:+ start:19208 stop:20113 length:906 start_codon:yes stop_codon:yes gene_type:complete